MKLFSSVLNFKANLVKTNSVTSVSKYEYVAKLHLCTIISPFTIKIII